MDFASLDWRSIAGAVAPLAPKLGTVLGTTIGGLIVPGFGAGIGGSIGGIAGRAIAAKFGVEATPEAVGKAIAEDPEAHEKLQQLEAERGEEIAAQAQVEIARINAAVKDHEIAAGDVQQAREWSARPDNPFLRTQIGFAYLFAGAFFAILALFIWKPDVIKVSDAFLLLLGVVIGMMKDIGNFLYSSTAGSQSKDATVRQMAAEAVAAPATAQRQIGNIVKDAVNAARKR